MYFEYETGNDHNAGYFNSKRSPSSKTVEKWNEKFLGADLRLLK